MREKLPTLSEFLMKSKRRAAYVREPGFEELYVRSSTRYLGGQMRQCLDVGRVVAEETGKGTFRAFIARVRTLHPDLEIFVESVQTERFCEGLKRMGFECVMPSYPPSFWLRSAR